MMNEALYMEIRLLQQFCTKYNMSPLRANQLFKDCAIWSFIEDCYDTLHMNGDEYVLNDITQIVTAKGVHL